MYSAGSILRNSIPSTPSRSRVAEEVLLVVLGRVDGLRARVGEQAHQQVVVRGCRPARVAPAALDRTRAQRGSAGDASIQESKRRLSRTTTTRLRAPAGGSGRPSPPSPPAASALTPRSFPGRASSAACGTPSAPRHDAARQPAQALAQRRPLGRAAMRGAERDRVGLRRPLDLEAGGGDHRPVPGGVRRSTTGSCSPPCWCAAARPRLQRRQQRIDLLGGEEVARADAADRLECRDRVLQMQHQAPADDDVEAADRLRRQVVDAELAALDLRAEQLAGDLEAAAGARLAAAGDRRRVPSGARCSGQSHSAASPMSTAITSAAPRRSSSKERKPS